MHCGRGGGASINHHQRPLYGRKREVAFLREWSLMSASASPGAVAGASRLLLLGGARGVGKGALTRSLRFTPLGGAKRDTRTDAVFVSGRFHPARSKTGQRPPPGRPMSAFWDSLNQLFGMNDLTETNSLQSAILSEFREADDVDTLMEMMPASRQWLAGRRGRSGSDMSSESARTGPQYVINKRMLNTGVVDLAVRFVRAISTCVSPYLILCMEHMEYADSATFELIDSLLCNTTIGGFLQLIATYREDTDCCPSLEQLLSQANEASMDGIAARHVLPQRIVKVTLGSISWEDMYQWTLHHFGRQTLSDDMLQSVADLVYEKSAGNPQFALYLIEYIAGHRKMYRLNDKSIEELRAAIPDNVNKLFALAIRKQEPCFADVVEVAAALGECRGGLSLEVSTLNLVLRHSFAEAVVSEQKGGIFVPSDASGGAISFPCSEFQRVAYSLIPEARRLALHLKIGRRLWKQSSSGLPEIIPDEGSTSLMFLGAQNLNYSMELVTDLGELNTIVNISIDAGKRAMESSRFPLAACYFELAISALRDRLWNAECYDISLALFNGISEAYYCSADFDSVERSLDVVFQNAATFQDKLQAYTTLVYAHSAQNRIDDAMSLATHILRQVGEEFPANPSTFQLMMEYLKIRRLFKGKPDRFFLSLPSATDPEKVTTMRMMSFTSFTTYIVHPNLSLLMTFRLLQSMLKHGISGPAIVALASYAYFLSVFAGHIEEGTRFGKLALAFLDQGEGLAWLPRITFPVHGLVYRTAYPLRDSLQPLQKAYRSALKVGDMEGSHFTAFVYHAILFQAGTPLGLVEEELRSHTRLMDSLGQQFALTHLVPMWQFVCDLLGSVPSPLNLVGEITNAKIALDVCKENNIKMSLGNFYLYQTIYHCLMGEYDGALDMAKKSRETCRGSDMWLKFYEGFAALAKARSSSVRSIRWKALSVGRKALKSMKTFCHDNFGSKVALLEAEISALKGNHAKAVSLYNLSIKLAKEQGFLLEEGLAYERVGHLQSMVGINAVAIPYYEAAYRTYERWDACALVARIERITGNLDQSTSQRSK